MFIWPLLLGDRKYFLITATTCLLLRNAENKSRPVLVFTSEYFTYHYFSGRILWVISYHSRKKGNHTWAMKLSLHRQQVEWKWTPVWKQNKKLLVCCHSGWVSQLEEAVEDRSGDAWHWNVFIFTNSNVCSQIYKPGNVHVWDLQTVQKTDYSEISSCQPHKHMKELSY